MPQQATVKRVCETCKGEFWAKPVDVKRGRSRFCSRSCASKARPNPHGSGPDNPAWKGGLTKSTRGYWYVWKPDHHRANKHGYVKRADLVMEEEMGRLLEADELVHHGPGGKEDDSPNNLTVMTKKKHDQHHGSLLRKPPKPRKPHAPQNRRYNWPSDERLLEMRRLLSLREIAAVIGCNHKAVDRRLQKIQRQIRDQ